MKKLTRFIIEFVLGFIAYGLGLVALNLWFDPNSSYWVVLLPAIPLLYIATAIIRYITKLDEMQRKIFIEAMAFSGLATGFTCFNYLFLRDMGAPEFKAEWTFFAMWSFFGIGMIWSSKRYQ